MSDTIIKVENLSKRYRIGAKEEGYKTFREAIIDGFTAPIRNLKRLRKLTKFDDPERQVYPVESESHSTGAQSAKQNLTPTSSNAMPHVHPACPTCPVGRDDRTGVECLPC